MENLSSLIVAVLLAIGTGILFLWKLLGGKEAPPAVPPVPGLPPGPAPVLVQVEVDAARKQAAEDLQRQGQDARQRVQDPAPGAPDPADDLNNVLDLRRSPPEKGKP